MVNLNERSYVPRNAAKRSAHTKLNKLCKHLNLTNEERLELNSNLSACKSTKWGIDYRHIKVLKSLSNYYRTLLSKSDIRETKMVFNLFMIEFSHINRTLILILLLLMEAIKEDGYWRYIKVGGNNIVDPISDSDFSPKQLHRLNRQCNLIYKLLINIRSWTIRKINL